MIQITCQKDLFPRIGLLLFCAMLLLFFVVTVCAVILFWHLGSMGGSPDESRLAVGNKAKAETVNFAVIEPEKDADEESLPQDESAPVVVAEMQTELPVEIIFHLKFILKAVTTT